MNKVPGVQWSNIRARMPGWLIAMVDAKSSEAEQRALVEFSVRTKRTLGREGLLGETYPFLNMSSWEDAEEDEGQLRVFAAILDGRVVGYAICQLHQRITDAEGNLLGPEGEPLPAKPSRIWSLKDFLEASPDDFPKTLETWCLEAIAVEPKFQRSCIGAVLLRTAAESLGTTLEDMAYGEPISDSGAALLSSLGLSLDNLRRCIT